MPIVKIPSLPPAALADSGEAHIITQDWIWGRIAQFMRPNDVVLGETGTAAFGLPDATFPPKVKYEKSTRLRSSN